MRLRNVLIVVNDMARSVRFYRELFGLQIILDQGENVIMTEGLVLQDARVWKDFLKKELIPKNHMTELYFEEKDMDSFVKKLEASDFEIEYVSDMVDQDGGKKLIRFYDPDGNLIEVGTPV
jgi:catechol 2,3-dioxygenase-like lactoylglutathione lyase family enzyme